MAAIDYPKRPLVDSGVLIAAWTVDKVEPERENCVAFLEGVEAAGGVILIATPTIAEVLRGTPPVDLPRRRSVVPVAFDHRAAVILGRDIPATELKKLRQGGGLPLAFFKYDAMIAACAKAHRADCIVSLDGGDMPKLAAYVDVPYRHPRIYRQPQQKKLDLPPGEPQ